MVAKTLADIIEARLNRNNIMEQNQKADDLQAGGTHYKEMAVQPWTIMQQLLTEEEFMGYLKGNIIKYGMRQGRKDSPDAEKCQHYIQKLKEFREIVDWE